MERGADSSSPAGPGERNRRCIVSGGSAPAEGLIRFVVGPNAEVVPDLDERLPGRGIWVTASRAAIETAVAKRLFSRAARAAVEAPSGLADRIETLLVRRCQETLGLARRSGSVTAGYEKVRAALKSGRGGLLVEAADGAADGRQKLTALAGGARPVAVLTAVELGQPLGREQAVHLLLAPGKLTARFERDAARLSGIRREGAEEAGEKPNR